MSSFLTSAVKAIFAHNHCFPFPCWWECITLTRQFQKADWTRLCFTLSKSFCLCALHLTGVAKVVIYQKPITLNTKGNQRILKISESEWTDRNDGWSTSGEMTSVRSSGECEFLAELSTFDLQESSEATLYKWAKFLCILDIILTC